MKEICWKAFLLLPAADRESVLMRCFDELTACFIVKWQSMDKIRDYIERDTKITIRFHAAVVDCVKRLRGHRAADLLRQAM